MSNKILYVIGGIIIGVGAYMLYENLKSHKVTVKVNLTSNNKIPNDTRAVFNLHDADGNEIIKGQVMKYTVNEEGKRVHETVIDANKIKRGGYIAIVDFFNDADDYIGTIEGEIVFPHDVGLMLPERIPMSENLIILNMRG